MATIEIQTILQQLEPKYRQLLTDYLQYLIYLQNQRAKDTGLSENKILPEAAAQATPTNGEKNIPKRLRILRQYRDIAPKPHFPVSKYDVYEQ